jgi:hypothetical protein
VEVKRALIRLLPRLQSTDACLLLQRQRKALNQFLQFNESYGGADSYLLPDLKIAVLRALEQVGDETVLPTVEKLAKSAGNPTVRLAAQECLPFLQQRTEEARVQQTLLRASGPGASPEVLLRPTTHGVETDPQQLLRASTVDEP